MDSAFQGKCRQLHKYAVARQDVLEARLVCKLLIQRVSDWTEPLYFPLATAAVVCYARPFTDNNGYGRLGKKWERFPNTMLQKMHQQLVAARDAFIAHSDADSRMARILPVGWRILEIDKITERPEIQVGRFHIDVQNFPIARSNCDYLVDRLDEGVDALLAQIAPEIDLRNGPVDIASLYT